jgi:hypothetical protein
MTGEDSTEEGAALMEKNRETKGSIRQVGRNFFFIYYKGKGNYQTDRC